MLEHWIYRKTFAAEQLFDGVPALERPKRIQIWKEKVLALHRMRLRQHFQRFRGPADLVQPRSERCERLIVAVSEALYRIRNELIDQDWILSRTNFQRQELVIRPGIGMIFKSVRHFPQAHRPSGWI